MNLYATLGLLGLAGTAGAAGLWYSRWVEPFQLEIVRKEAPTPDWPATLDGLTVLHLSDLHFRGHDPRTWRWIDRVAELEPDLIALTGDFIDFDGDIAACTHLRRLRARYGRFAVFGNHDRYHNTYPVRALISAALRGIGESNRPRSSWVRPNDLERLERTLQAAGITVLRNENRLICIKETPLYIVGVDDPYYRFANARAALQGVPEGAPRIVLGHTPSTVRYFPHRGTALVLSGHTHGGQLNLPGIRWLRQRRVGPPHHFVGLYRTPTGHAHVSRGIGSARILPLRFRCRPEAALITLRSTS